MNSYDMAYPVVLILVFFVGMIVISAYINNRFKRK
jgi:hypothetical protein